MSNTKKLIAILILACVALASVAIFLTVVLTERLHHATTDSFMGVGYEGNKLPIDTNVVFYINDTTAGIVYISSMPLTLDPANDYIAEVDCPSTYNGRDLLGYNDLRFDGWEYYSYYGFIEISEYSDGNSSKNAPGSSYYWSNYKINVTKDMIVDDTIELYAKYIPLDDDDKGYATITYGLVCSSCWAVSFGSREEPIEGPMIDAMHFYAGNIYLDGDYIYGGQTGVGPCDGCAGLV